MKSQNGYNNDALVNPVYKNGSTNHCEIQITPIIVKTKGILQTKDESHNNQLEIEVENVMSKKERHINQEKKKSTFIDKVVGVQKCSIKLNPELVRQYKKSNICSLKAVDSNVLPYEFHINNNENNLVYEYRNNMINLSKYNIFTFFPKALIFQFARLANVYFLVMAILQLIPIISPLSPSTAVVPLCCVLLFSIVREGVEDLARHKYDDKLNSEPATLYINNTFKSTTSGNLQIGELILVKKDEEFPADIIQLDSSIENGVCRIETATLDGEKAPKNKIAEKVTAGIFRKPDSSIRNDINLVGVCSCDKPGPDLYKFDGKISITYSVGQGEKKIIETGLDAKQLLLKGMFI